jgi:hypothetical protein
MSVLFELLIVLQVILLIVVYGFHVAMPWWVTFLPMIIAITLTCLWVIFFIGAIILAIIFFIFA